MADSEDLVSNSCYRNLTMILPVFCWSLSGVDERRRAMGACLAVLGRAVEDPLLSPEAAIR